MSTENNMKKEEENAEAPSTSTSSSGEAPRFLFKKWNPVALWSWDIDVENCAICRNGIMDSCIECQADQAATSFTNNPECIVAWGICNHAFHYHCINRWLKTRKVCPLDNADWEYLKYGR